GWENVNDLGVLDREKVIETMKRAIVGIVVFLPLPNHVHAQPNKLFEYMSSGLPVIASNFPLWKEIVEKNNCGICVDPLNPQEIAKAISFLMDNHQTAKKMGENGIKRVKEEYNWDIEGKKLIDVYEKLLKN
ncbi:glycosyltransferase, partial [bacterium AH-315-M05]|nr:glycosyltransferase [bacterium AH-315-M05]